MLIHLSDDLEQAIQDLVAGGRFASVDEAMAEAARLLLREVKSGHLARPATAPPAADADIPDPLWGLMRADATLMDEIVADAYRQRQAGS